MKLFVRLVSLLILLLMFLTILSGHIGAQEENEGKRDPTETHVQAPIDGVIQTSTGGVNRGVFTGSNPTALTITDAITGNLPQPSTPLYPSPITVSGLSGPITAVTITLTGLNITVTADIDVLVVGPGGQNLMLMSDVWSSGDALDATLTFDDTAAAPIPKTAPTSESVLDSGSYRPTNASNTEGCQADPDVAFPSPAPTVSAHTTLAEAFNGLTDTAVNGDWLLYIVDDCFFIEGTLTGGWSITITTIDPTATPTATLTETATATLTSTPTATATATLTSTPTATATATAGTPASTPIATETEIATAQLVVNGGFETDLTPWVLKNPTGDKVKCNTETKQIANSGLCAFQFKGSPAENSKIQQNIALGDVTFAAGDNLDLSVFVHVKKAAPGVKIKIVVAYNDLPEKTKISSEIGSTSGYVNVTGSKPLLSAAVSKIKFQISTRSTSGKIYVDDVSLAQVAGAPALLPLP